MHEKIKKSFDEKWTEKRKLDRWFVEKRMREALELTFQVSEGAQRIRYNVPREMT